MASKSYEKLVTEIGNLTVLELSDLVKELETAFGVSAAMPMASAAAAAPVAEVAKAEEKAEYKVTLQDAGADKIKVIKALKSVTQLNLTDAKKMVEGAPAVVVEAAPKADAQKIKEALEAAGAKVQLS